MKPLYRFVSKKVDNEEMCFRGSVGIELINKNLQI